MSQQVLIVEDDELLREMYASKFEMEGFEVLTAEDGQQGLDTALRHEPELMILDNLMPHLSGLQVLERYRAAKPGHTSLVFFLSNKSSLGDINYAKELGAADYLIKSQYTPRDLVAKIQQYLNH